MRRIYDPTQYKFLEPFYGMNTFITVMALCLGASQIFFVINFIKSLFARPAGYRESLASQYPGMGCAFSTTSRQFSHAPSGLSWALRMTVLQRSRRTGYRKAVVSK